MKDVKDFLLKDIKLNENDIIVVGVSAGPDSMALLDILIKLREKIKFKIIVSHVNHNLRQESYEECEFLKKYCFDNSILFESMIIEEYGDDNFHNEARNIRYNFYESLIDKYSANYLMTGHHGDDLIETILMRMVRGSTLKGYSGFHKIVDNGKYKIVRPLIYLTKEELMNYDIDNNVPYRIDQSNFKDKYTRNRYRKYVLPFLKEEDNNVHRKFLSYNETLIEYDNYISKETKRLIGKAWNGCFLDINKFLEFDTLIQKRVLDIIIESIYQDDLIQIDNRHIKLIFDAINSKRSNIKYSLPNDYILTKEYDKLFIKKEINSINGYDIELSDNVILPNGFRIVRVLECDSDGNDVLRLNSSDVTLPLRVRTRRNGDKIFVKNLEGSKKISKILIDKKVSISKRETWPVVVDSCDKVVWLPNLKKSKYNRLKEEKCDIIYKCYQGEDYE